MRAYWRSDPADVSVNAICQMAEISKPSLYREFGGEDGLTLAVIDAYAEQVLSDIFARLGGGGGGDLDRTLKALIDFAGSDPKMENGCLFHKMQAGKHRLGPKTRLKIEEIEAAAQDGFRAFLDQRREAGDLTAAISVDDGARYLAAQIGLAFTQRAAGAAPETVRRSLSLALSVFER
ncbi:MAG: TetR/AcrR family transcriptional regulator [Pseudomonadota bacterium]